MNILVIDVGTSSMRGTLLDDNATPLYSGQIKYHPMYCENDIVYQSPSDWTDALTELCRGAAATGVDALAITAQRSSVIPLDDDNNAVLPAIMWQDKRNRETIEKIMHQKDRVRAVCGTGINTVFSGGKMKWFREEEPKLYEKTARFAVIADLLTHFMTGEWKLDDTYGSRSMMMDLRTKDWCPELLELFNVEREKLSDLTSPSTVIGTIDSNYAKLTGLAEGTLVISCGGDQQCGALGQGVIEPGDVSVNFGTGAYVIMAADRFPEGLSEKIACNTYSIPGMYILESSLLTCGSALDWLLGILGHPGETQLVGESLRKSPKGAGGAIASPFFQGSLDANMPTFGEFANMTIATTKYDLIRALLEGICNEIRKQLDEMERISPINNIRISGGLTKTPEFCELLADALQRTVIRSDDGNATTNGAWMSAMYALEQEPDMKKIYERIPSDGETFVKGD